MPYQTSNHHRTEPQDISLSDLAVAASCEPRWPLWDCAILTSPIQRFEVLFPWKSALNQADTRYPLFDLSRSFGSEMRTGHRPNSF